MNWKEARVCSFFGGGEMSWSIEDVGSSMSISARSELEAENSVEKRYHFVVVYTSIKLSQAC